MVKLVLVHGQPVHQTLECELTFAARNRHRCHHLSSSSQDGFKGNDNHDMEYNDGCCKQYRQIPLEISNITNQSFGKAHPVILFVQRVGEDLPIRPEI